MMRKTCSTFLVCLALLRSRRSLRSGHSDRLLHASDEPQNWLTYSGSYSSQRYSPLKQIDPANVKNLELKWVFQAQSLQKFETTPLVVDGIMYVTQSPNDVVALDAKTGRVFWIYHYAPSPDVPALLRDRESRSRHSRRYAVHGDRRRASGRHRRQERPGALEHQGGRRGRGLRHDARAAGGEGQSDRRRGRRRVSAFAASSPPTTRRPARKPGASTRFPVPASPATKPGTAMIGSTAAHPSG